MQWHIGIDLACVRDWDLNMQQAVVFAYLYTCPSWCDKAEDDPEFFNISTGKLATELAALSEKRDTMLRYVMQLVDAGVIERRTIKRNQYVKLTEKGQEWNRRRHVSERDEFPAPGAQRDKHPAQRDKHPAQRDKHPGATGQTSEESVNQHQETIRGKAKGAAAPRSDKPDHAMVIGLYNEILHELPTVFADRWKSNSPRAKALQARWREEDSCKAPDFWRAFFAEVRRNDFWMRRTPAGDGRYFEGCNLEWLLQPKRFEQVIERALDREERGQ